MEILRAGGYQVRAIPGDVRSRISASDIREAMAARLGWRAHVPTGATEVLMGMGDEELARRCSKDVAGT